MYVSISNYKKYELSTVCRNRDTISKYSIYKNGVNFTVKCGYTMYVMHFGTSSIKMCIKCKVSIAI